MTAIEACKPFWRYWATTDAAQTVVVDKMITKLPDEVLGLVLQHVDFQEKCGMQLVCRKFGALLSSPPPGLWGELNIVTDIINSIDREHRDLISRQVPHIAILLRMP